MDNEDGANIMPVPWDRLKAWIEAQEQAERSGFNPNPPTKVQIAALSHVVDFLDGPEPTIGNRDYVTDLMHLIQSKQVAPPKFEDLAPIEVPINGALSLRWRTVCYLPFAHNKQFPCSGYGLHDDKQLLLWKSKKLSKQYAAKHAYQYMRAHIAASTSSNGGASLASSSSNGNNNASFNPNSSAKAQASSGGAPLTSPSSMLPSPSSSTGDLTTVEDTDFYDSKILPSLLDQVKKETAYLKLGYPAFEIWPDEENPGAFAGKPVFKNNGRIPSDMGLIKGALTRGLAKELMAEQVLAYCKTVRKQKEGIMSTFNGPVGE